MNRSRSRVAALLIGGSLLIGLTVGALSYLGSSLVLGPGVRADADELRERGAQMYFESCAGFFEPRFWPECVGDANAKRARGARELVAFCTGEVRYNRFFQPENCLSRSAPPLALTAGPRRADVVAGAVAAAVALALMAGVTVVRTARASPG